MARSREIIPSLVIVVPCYNESDVLKLTAMRLNDLLQELGEMRLAREDSRICMVDDGSVDDTWEIIQEICRSNGSCCGLRLTRNFGHQNALLAGLLSVPGDVVVSMDADLQDDPAIVAEMLNAHDRGADVVYAARSSRRTDSWLKRVPAETYYKLLRAMGVNLVANHADFRLMSRRVIESLRGYHEVNLFLRGLLPQLGYRQAVVYYERQPRAAGKSKYSVRKMVSLAVDGITSFSVAPLRLIALIGVLVFAGSLILSAWALGVRLFTENAVPGWASSVLPIYLLGGVHLVSIAVVGEYIAKVYLETKARPRFLVENSVGIQEEPQSLPGKTKSER